MTTISERIHTLTSDIQQIAARRNIQCPVTLVAVSKYHSQESIIEAIGAGQRVFGENKVQEIMMKWPKIKEHHADVTLHMIGALQTNKVKDVFALCDVIESVDRPSLVKEIAKQQEKTGKILSYFIQVNLGEEPQKSGVLPNQLDALMALCHDMHVPIKGLMCLPPAGKEPRPYFSYLKQCADRLSLNHVSMGMSGDYPTAIEEGATHIRVGTAIFGQRS